MSQLELVSDAPRVPAFVAVFDPAEAERLAAEGMARAWRAERVAEWKWAAGEWLARLRPGTEISADDLTAAVGLPDVPEEGADRNNVIGAFFRAQARRGRLVSTGTYRKSKRAERHGAMARVWRVAP